MLSSSHPWPDHTDILGSQAVLLCHSPKHILACSQPRRYTIGMEAGAKVGMEVGQL